MKKTPTPRQRSRQRRPRVSPDLRAMERQVKRLEEQVYYVVYERPFRGVDTRFYLDVCESAFRPSVWPCATLFKEELLARFVAREYSALRQRRFYVAPVTIQVSDKRGGGRKRRLNRSTT